MNCPVCGADNEASAAFCYRCGSSLKAASSTGPTVNLGQGTTPLYNTDPVSLTPEPESGAKVYDIPAAAPSDLPASDTAFGERTRTLPAQAPYIPSYTMPPQANVPSYTPPYAATQPQQSNTALIAMLLGIGSLVLYALLFCFVFLSPLSVVVGIPAIVLGRNARREISASGGQLSGDGMAQAGVILGWIDVVLSAITLCGIVAFFVAVAA